MRLGKLTFMRSPRAGVAGAWVAVAFVALAGAAALVVDLGTLVVAAQRCQHVADAAALAAGSYLPSESDARAAALATVAANNSEGTGWPVECTAQDCTFFGPGDTVEGRVLGPYACALQVTVRADVNYTFGRLFGLNRAVAERHATILRAPAEGIPLCTMWIAHETPMVYGQRISLLMADGPHCAGIPGSFGFLQSPPGCTANSFELLQDYDLTQQDIETSFVNLGDSVWADTGVDVGTFRKALETDLGRARLERGTTGKFQYDTFNDYHEDNPRIMLIPLVTYLGGTGSNAEFRIEKFGAFWLEEVNGGQKEIWGRFIQYDLPGGDPNSSLTIDTGVYATKLIG